MVLLKSMFELNGDRGEEYIVKYEMYKPIVGKLKGTSKVYAVSFVSAKNALIEQLQESKILSDDAVLRVKDIKLKKIS